jgi:hypothetical protein
LLLSFQNGAYVLKSILCFSRIKSTGYINHHFPFPYCTAGSCRHTSEPTPPPTHSPPLPTSGKKGPRSIIVYLCLIYTRRTPLMQSVGASVRHLPHTACEKGAPATSLFLPPDLHLDSVPHPSAKTPDKFFLLQPPLPPLPEGQ